MTWKIVASLRIPSVGIGELNCSSHLSQPQHNGRTDRINPSLTFKKGGPPLGNSADNAGWSKWATDPPAKDQKFSGCVFCQSYQTLSII